MLALKEESNESQIQQEAFSFFHSKINPFTKEENW